MTDSSPDAGHGTGMHLGLVGLGKMGANMRQRLRERGVEVTGYDRNPEVSDVESLAALVAALPEGRRAVWVMVPAGAPTRSVVAELGTLLTVGDIVVEGGNSHYKEDVEHAASLEGAGSDLSAEAIDTRYMLEETRRTLAEAKVVNNVMCETRRQQ